MSAGVGPWFLGTRDIFVSRAEENLDMRALSSCQIRITREIPDAPRVGSYSLQHPNFRRRRTPYLVAGFLERCPPVSSALGNISVWGRG